MICQMADQNWFGLDKKKKLTALWTITLSEMKKKLDHEEMWGWGRKKK